MAQAQRVLVLRKELSGESFLKLHLLGPELGLQLCLKRVAQKKLQNTSAPDLFDTAELQINPSKQGTARFLSSYELIERRTEIGQNYRRLKYASDLSNLLIANGGHMADLPALYELTEKSMDAFAQKLEPAVTFFKTLFLLLKEEGYAVRESWWPQTPARLRGTARQLLNQPCPETISGETRAQSEELIEHLQGWMLRETDLRLPESA